MMGLLHDVVEDTHITLDDLRQAGVPRSVVSGVAALTRPPAAPGQVRLTYQGWIEEMVVRERYGPADMISPTTLASLGCDPCAKVPMALAIKLADNGHNSSPERGIISGMEPRYTRARTTLVEVIPHELVVLILERINPSLLALGAELV